MRGNKKEFFHVGMSSERKDQRIEPTENNDWLPIGLKENSCIVRHFSQVLFSLVCSKLILKNLFLYFYESILENIFYIMESVQEV